MSYSRWFAPIRWQIEKDLCVLFDSKISEEHKQIQRKSKSYFWSWENAAQPCVLSLSGAQRGCESSFCDDRLDDVVYFALRKMLSHATSTSCHQDRAIVHLVLMANVNDIHVCF